MTIFLTGGGSGGHILPNLALLPKLHKEGITVRYIGEYGGMEQRLVHEAGIPFHGIVSGKLRRYASIRTLWDMIKLPIGVMMAIGVFLHHRPSVLFSKGGYVSVPACIAAWVLRIPLVVHESDVKPGLTTRITARLAKVICVSWEETRSIYPHAQLTGIPVREEILRGNKARGKKMLQTVVNTLPTLLIMGGSLGAKVFNDFITQHHLELLTAHNIIHITGGQDVTMPKKIDTPKGWYRSYTFLGTELADILAVADIVLSRAGATALAELVALGKRCILVPLPLAASRGDQIDNAAAIARLHPKTMKVLDQNNLDTYHLLPLLQDLVGTTSTPIATNACDIIALVLLSPHTQH